ncbi:glycosyltransferase family protein [Jannaschia ovalis]|uniref:Glycosyl transferase n=1 Tax=Jannaschia ovalis TaxID=3038773 RepID=A0ABY8LC67_9RHOB|nr:glycosyl transferase [Jannaschia sp. GRR-S6-38]WGH78923.1 glycosyl transferase [Jannaschia sp. GRR-S6-38]
MAEPATRPIPGPAAATRPKPARIEVFGFDVAEISQIRRIRAMIALGHEVHSFTMRRRNMNAGFTPDWPDTRLYETRNEALGRRAAVVAAAMLKMTGHRERLRAADVIVARNLDMLAIAAAARRMAGSRAALVYECLDIHAALTGPGARAAAMRAAERGLLAGVDMLAVSSPAFIRQYFEPVQGWRGPWALWENKLAAGMALPKRPAVRPARAGPLRLGWVGTIRCAPSLDLLAVLAGRMGGEVEIHIHGVVHRHALPGFDAAIAAQSNIFVHGPYSYPDDLARIYGSLDLVWAQDLWRRGANSDWLLPNRIYEASWAGCPSLALAGTETGRRVAADGLGWAIDRPDPALLEARLRSLPREAIRARGQALLDRADGDFVQDPSEIGAAIDRVRALTVAS